MLLFNYYKINMENIKKISKEISKGLIALDRRFDDDVKLDLSDFGNEIGFLIGKHISKKKMGYSLDDFIAGIKHGVSLVDGSHDEVKKKKDNKK